MELVDLNLLVPSNHVYREFKKVFDFTIAEEVLSELEHPDRYNGFGPLRLFSCLLIQHLENLSDRELERFMQENNAAKWFCDFELMDKTPDYSVFSKFRKRLGVEKLNTIFQLLKKQLQNKGLMNEFFSVVDATHLISKAALWEERDQAIKEKYEKLNNSNVEKFAKDKDARIGSKGKNKFWFGYKVTRCIDMQSGLINNTDVSSANTPDSKALMNVLPGNGAIYADKGYCSKEAEKEVNKLNCTLRAVKRNNMKDKNRELDKYITKLRSPFERMFSQMNKRARYIGKTKNFFSELLDVMSFNMKRLVVLNRASCV
jgi:IS5 family transposase